MDPDVFRYRAFISYSHNDSIIARWLHRKLEAYRLPSKLVGRMTPVGPVPHRLWPVFRDEDESQATRDLSAQVLRALDESAFLIVVCSPSAAASAWVNEEIRAYKALGRNDRILCVIVSGEPSISRRKANNFGCYPPALFRTPLEGDLVVANGPAPSDDELAMEPAAADLRAGASPRLALLKIVAGLVGLRLDDLRQRDQERRKRVVVAAGLTSFALCVLLGWLILARFEAQRDADRQASTALATSKRLSAQRLAEQSRAILQGTQPLPATKGWLLAVAAYRSASGPATLSALQLAAMQAQQQAAYFRVDGEVQSLEFSHDGRWVAVRFRRQTDPSKELQYTDEVYVQLRHTEDGSAYGAPIAVTGCENFMRFSPDGSRIVCGDGLSISALNIVENGLRLESSLFSKLARQPNIVDGAFVSTSDRLVVLLSDGSLEDWDTRRLEPVGEARYLAEGPVTSLTASHDGRRLLVAFKGGSVREFDATTRRAIGKARQTGSSPKSLGYSRDNKPVITLEEGQTINLQGENAGNPQIWTARLTNDWPLWRDSPDGSFRVAWGRGHLARIWHRSGSEEKFQELAQDGVIGTVAIHDGRRLVAISSADGSVRLWRVSGGAPLVGWLLSRDKEIMSLALHDDRLAIAQVDGKVELFNWRRKEVVGTLHPQPLEPVRRVAFTAQGEWLVTQDDEGAVTWWNSRTLTFSVPPAAADSMLEQLRWPRPSRPTKIPLAVPSIGGTAATTDGGRKILLMDASMRPIDRNALLGHDADVMALAFDSDGRRLASGGADSTALIWDVALRSPIGLPLRHGGEVSALVFTADGRHLFTGSYDKFVRMWDIDVNSWVKIICDHMPRAIPTEEWSDPGGENLTLSAVCSK